MNNDHNFTINLIIVLKGKAIEVTYIYEQRVFDVFISLLSWLLNNGHNFTMNLIIVLKGRRAVEVTFNPKILALNNEQRVFKRGVDVFISTHQFN